MIATSNHYKKYNTSVKFAERELSNLEKTFADENKNLLKLQKAWSSGKERVQIAKTKAKNSKSASIKKSVDLIIKKQEQVSKQYNVKKSKIIKLRESIRDTNTELKKINSEKRLYEKAMEKYEKQWMQFYSGTFESSKNNLSSADKVDFGLQLRAARALLNLSIYEFSTLLDIPSNLLKQIEQPNNIMSLEPHLQKNIQTKLKASGIELIEDGLYVGTGGVGVRISKKPSRARSFKPKGKRAKKTSTKTSTVKKKRKLTMKKVA